MQRLIGKKTSENGEPGGSAGHDPSRLRLDALDGIRGLAALYVALYHALGYAGYTTTQYTDLSAPMQLIAAILDLGVYAVPVFIVVSGFCLMLPLAQRDTTYLPGGVSSYVLRRAWRILPSYYVMLLLSLGLIALLPILQTPQQTNWDTKIPVTIGAIISHLLLIHNIHPGWIYKINGPMWSVAVEWQIYFLFPALLLPLLRRSNLVITVVLATAVGTLPHLLLPARVNLDDMHPWFVGLFAMGMAGAVVAFSNDPKIAAYRMKIRWGWLTAALAIGLSATLFLKKDWTGWHPYITEPWVGIVVMCWLIQYIKVSRQGERRSLSQRLLESRTLVTLGIFSYSIYLVHNPIQGLVNLETLHINMSADARLAMMLVVVTPFAVLCSYGFYLLFERKFMRMKTRVVSVARPAFSSAPAITDGELGRATDKS